MEARFKLGDKVLHNGRGGATIYTVTATGPRHRLPDEEPWYSLSDGQPEAHIRTYFDAFDRDLSVAS
jgi:hypothetical protein